jgi:hypothetical protein
MIESSAQQPVEVFRVDHFSVRAPEKRSFEPILRSIVPAGNIKWDEKKHAWLVDIVLYEKVLAALVDRYNNVIEKVVDLETRKSKTVKEHRKDSSPNRQAEIPVARRYQTDRSNQIRIRKLYNKEDKDKFPYRDIERGEPRTPSPPRRPKTGEIKKGIHYSP